MKKLLLLLGIGILVFFYVKNSLINYAEDTSLSLTATPLPSSNAVSAGLSFAKIKVDNIQSLTLHVNTKDQKAAKEAQQDNNCKYLVNGGFYSKENSPLGLIINDGKTLSPRITSSLFDGYVSITNANIVSISTDANKADARVSLQTGPLLIRNKAALDLKIRNDKPARRMVAIKDTQGDLWFVSVYNPNSVYSGPLLAELPQKLKEMETSLGIEISDAINLDGGSASAFISDSTSLEEISFIGSFFCIR